MFVLFVLIIGLCIAVSSACLIFFEHISGNKEIISKNTSRIRSAEYLSITALAVLVISYSLTCFVNSETAIPFWTFIVILLGNILFLFILFASITSLKCWFIILWIFGIIGIGVLIFNLPILFQIELGGLVGVALGFLIISIIAQKHALFINTAKSVCLGATAEELQKIFGEPTSKEEEEDGKLTITYEKTQWRGFLRGGTIVRSVKVTLVDEKVVKVTTKNMDVPVW